MTAMFYIAASVGVIVLCAVSYALGHRNGRIDGWNDGYEYRARECNGMCAR